MKTSAVPRTFSCLLHANVSTIFSQEGLFSFNKKYVCEYSCVAAALSRWFSVTNEALQL